MRVRGESGKRDVPEVVLEWLIQHSSIMAIDMRLPDSLRLVFFVRGILGTGERADCGEEILSSMDALQQLTPGRGLSFELEWVPAGGLTMLGIRVHGIPERGTVGLLVALLKRRFGSRLIKDGSGIAAPLPLRGEGMNRRLHGKNGTSIVAFRAEGTLRVYRYSGQN